MMDRLIGALSTAYVGNARGGGLYYQFGRKDPVPAGITLYNINGTALAATAPVGFPAQKWNPTNANATVPPSGVVVPLSVANPMVVFNSNNDWSGMNENSYLYLDSKLAKGNSLVKSIYDPCPPGWHLPVLGCYADFRMLTKIAYNNGMQYYPRYDTGGGNYPVNGMIFYAGQGYRNYSGAMQNNNHVFVVEATQASVSGVYHFHVQGTLWDSIEEHAADRAYPYEVRCVSLSPEP